MLQDVAVYLKNPVLEMYAILQLLWLNPQVRVEHLAIQFLLATAQLLLARICPIYLEDELIFLFLVLLKEMRMLGESNVLPVLSLVLIKGIRGWGESRSGIRRCSTKKAVLKNFAVFTRKHLCWSLF